MDRVTYDRLYIEQRGLCAVCWKASAPNKRLLIEVDSQDNPSALVCSRCQQGLDLLGRDPVVVGRAHQYLSRGNVRGRPPDKTPGDFSLGESRAVLRERADARTQRRKQR